MEMPVDADVRMAASIRVRTKALVDAINEAEVHGLTVGIRIEPDVGKVNGKRWTFMTDIYRTTRL